MFLSACSKSQDRWHDSLIHVPIAGSFGAHRIWGYHDLAGKPKEDLLISQPQNETWPQSASARKEKALKLEPTLPLPFTPFIFIQFGGGAGKRHMKKS